MYLLLESIKIMGGEPQLIDLHQERVNKTLRYFNKNNTLDLYALISQVKLPEKGLYKCRILYNLNLSFTHELTAYERTNTLDFSIVKSNDIHYQFKFINREIFLNLKSKSNNHEIIIVKNNKITDTSFSNLIFLKGYKWYTPSSYLLNGVMRQFLIRTKKIEETEITLDNITEFSHFKIINAMNSIEDGVAYPLKKIKNINPSF
ncbi:MAG: aminodeoxychorismate lyase [Bergeyella sp.]|nr:aminodeoxychorismate lyase [Bergeyella sp.]